MKKLSKNYILDIGVTNATRDEIGEFIFSGLKKSRDRFFIVTPNPEIITYAQHDSAFLSILNKADISLCDGAGILWAGKFLGEPLKERIPGVDMFRFLCQLAEEEGKSIGLLGGEKGIAERTKQCLKLEFPKLNVVLATKEWDKRYNTIAIDILFVAFGFPKQEIWIDTHLPTSKARVMMGVGGTFDYISGKVPRAPSWIRKSSLEWLYRLIKQPWRLKRQLIGSRFFLLVLKKKLHL